MKAAQAIFHRAFPGLETRSLDSTYNCVGLVFAHRRAWIDTQYVQAMLVDDEYKQVKEHELVPGDVVVYYSDADTPSHIGFVVSVNRDVAAAAFKICVLSQWGADGEYFHEQTAVPTLLGQPREYYSERKCW